MTKYVLTYHGGSGEMPTDAAAVDEMMAAWGAWYETIGANLVDGGNPFSGHIAIGADGSSIDNPADSMSGYTILNAADFDAARAIAQGCPVLAMGATIQISEAHDM
jgi:hypothetical protein